MALLSFVPILLLSRLLPRPTRHYVYNGCLEEEDDHPIPVVESK